MQSFTFPKLKTKNVAVHLHSLGEKSVRQGHPWIFESSILKISEDAQAGDRAIIFDKKKNKFLGLGLIDPSSPIRIKMLLALKQEKWSQEWLTNKFETAFNLRIPLFETDTNSFRFIYGENDGLPGLVVDCYDQVSVVKLYSPIWIPYLEWIVQAIQITLQTNNIKLETIVLRLSRSLQKEKILLGSLFDGAVIFGELRDETVIFREHGLLFSANVIHGHKTGYFLDHRHNRHKVGAFAQNKRVLDVFSYAGGFSVHALCGNATTVTSVDISKQALELSKANAALNGTFENHITCSGDAFVVMKNLAQEGETFDLLIIDPPSFAKRSSEIDQAINSYGRLTRAAILLAARNAMLVMASCSSRVSADVFEDTIVEQLLKQKRKFQIVERTFHDIDHPIGFPEGAYLKTIYIQMD